MHTQDAAKRELEHRDKLRSAWEKVRVLEEVLVETGRKHDEEKQVLEKKRSDDVRILEKRLQEAGEAMEKEKDAWQRERAKMRRDLDAARQAEVIQTLHHS